MIEKLCEDCCLTKSISDFSKVSDRGREYYRMRCKPCYAAYQRRWRESDAGKVWRDNLSSTQKLKYNNNRDVINEFKKQPCADCGKIYPPYVMDIDHHTAPRKGDKSKLIGQMARWSSDILNELKSCEVVCANCHRERTFTRKQIRCNYIFL